MSFPLLVPVNLERTNMIELIADGCYATHRCQGITSGADDVFTGHQRLVRAMIGPATTHERKTARQLKLTRGPGVAMSISTQH